MPRFFDFTRKTSNKAYFRQEGMCAFCGSVLGDSDQLEHGHHVIPNQVGNPLLADHAWLRAEDNCVILCDICHERVHQDGNYRTGAVAVPEEFRYSHGSDEAAHFVWCIKMENLARGIF